MTDVWPLGPGVVELPDGRRVRGRSLRAGLLPDQPSPQFGLYLLGRRPPAVPWESAWIRWRDFASPSDDAAALAALADAHRRCATSRVELACLGGRGRTGTALAALAVLAGVSPDVAVDWVRRHYQPGAVETPGQRRWVERLSVPS